MLDLFSAAAGGWSLGMHRAGYRTVAACEVEAWRRAVYSENNPGVKVYDDVRTLTADRLRADLGWLPDIVVGSPPCQDISSANTKGKGVEGERSGLYFEAIRIIGECRPRWFALENSANLRTRGADAVIAALEAIGYTCWPCVVRAGDVGANHERPRAWLIGCDLAQVGNTDRQRRTAGFGVAPGEGPDDVGSGQLRSHAEHGRDRALYAVDAPGIGHAGWWAWGHGPDGNRASPAAAGNASDSALTGHGGGSEVRSGREARDQHEGNHARARAGSLGTSQSGSAGQMGLCPPYRGAADRSGPDWSLSHLADHLRLDDGLSAWLAGTRVQIGDGKGQSAASLAVEAFGDAVIPQIPEAIGRAILRVEAAMAALRTPSTERTSA